MNYLAREEPIINTHNICREKMDSIYLCYVCIMHNVQCIHSIYGKCNNIVYCMFVSDSMLMIKLHLSFPL